MGYPAELTDPSDPLALDSIPTKKMRPPVVSAPQQGQRWIFVLIGVVAFGIRVVPVLSGTGLYALASYDGSVYYTAAAGLAHGLLPYRDFLLLHPPGIAIALLPFALIGEHVGDAQGLAVARVAWMALGAFERRAGRPDSPAGRAGRDAGRRAVLRRLRPRSADRADHVAGGGGGDLHPRRHAPRVTVAAWGSDTRLDRRCWPAPCSGFRPG